MWVALVSLTHACFVCLCVCLFVQLDAATVLEREKRKSIEDASKADEAKVVNGDQFLSRASALTAICAAAKDDIGAVGGASVTAGENSSRCVAGTKFAAPQAALEELELAMKVCGGAHFAERCTTQVILRVFVRWPLKRWLQKRLPLSRRQAGASVALLHAPSPRKRCAAVAQADHG